MHQVLLGSAVDPVAGASIGLEKIRVHEVVGGDRRQDGNEGAQVGLVLEDVDGHGGGVEHVHRIDPEQQLDRADGADGVVEVVDQ